MHFAVSIIAPPQYIHGEAVREVAESIHYGLLALGYDSILTPELDRSDRQYLIFCSNLLPHCPMEILPGSILYNLEQVSPESTWFDPYLLSLFRQYPVWDYSLQNIERLAQLGIEHVRYLPIGYVPQLTRIPQIAEDEQDIDVLFCGSLNDRRRNVLMALQDWGLKVEAVFGVYGAERDKLIARAKIILNLHYYEARVFEIVRVSYLLANRQFVISERGCDEQEEAEFAPGVVFVDYEDIVAACLAYLEEPAERNRIAEAGFEIMSQRNMARYLKQALA